MRVFLIAYLSALAVTNLVWEIAQLPLYAIWTTEPPAVITFAVLHCRAGDIMIGVGALILALAVVQSPMPPRHSGVIAVITVVSASGYTIFSEWLNVSIRGSWSYSAWMPIIPVIGTGLSPLAQWFVTPAIGARLCAALGKLES